MYFFSYEQKRDSRVITFNTHQVFDPKADPVDVLPAHYNVPYVHHVTQNSSININWLKYFPFSYFIYTT